MTIEDEINRWGQDLVKKLASINLAPLFPAIQQLVRNSIIRSFREGGRFGDENVFGGGSGKWLKSRRDGQTLRDKGILMNSITVVCSQVSGELIIKVGSNMPYARVHQYGIDQAVSVKSHSRTRRVKSKDVHAIGKRGQKLKKVLEKGMTTYTVNAFTRQMRMPARPYLTLQNEDLRAIVDLIQRNLPRLMG